ncbi:KIN12C [Symbiodinium natans]|uniref:KIN12C protein n=1 Tax=Symbiodinium natans TaxID=878477 RepID=A0A812Q5E5_9DINO|nr:KIN12C [Symbiodinium natans]
MEVHSMATKFCGQTVQTELEAIIAGSQRQVAARCTLYCTGLVEAAREDERQQLRDRQIAAGADSGGAWTRGFFGDSFAASRPAPEASQKLVQQPTLDKCRADRTTDKDCEWILRTAFSIRNKVIQRRRESEVDADAAEEAVARSRAVSMSKKQAPAILDPKLVEQLAWTFTKYRQWTELRRYGRYNARTVQVFKSGNLAQQIALWLPPAKLVAFRRLSSCCHQIVNDLLSCNEALRKDVEAALEDILHQKDNRVWVGIRVRPHNADAASFAVDRRQITLCLPSSSTSSMAPAPAASFVFNRVFDRQAKQTDVWSSLQAPLMRCFLRREHACLFAYGQTGSGKTHTMFGDPTSPSECGLAFRIAESLRELLQPADAASVEFSFLEVYNERIHDLLDNSRVCVLAGEREELAPGSAYYAAKRGDEHVVVRGLTRRRCNSDDLTAKIGEWLLEGATARIVGRTAFNPRSSRSHAVATIHVCWKKDPDKPAQGGRETRLHIVDLAGSERSGQYAIDGGQLREGAHINLSLSTLGRVVGALARGQGEHVPYRDSALTWLLSDAITGCHARAFMIATVQPEHAAETLSTLRYAQAYSNLQSDLSTKIPRLRAQVRSLLFQAEMAQREVELMCAQINENARIGKMNQWDRETLKSRVVQIRRHGEEHFRLHPYLKWTDVHDTKAKLNQIGLVEEVCSVPPVRESDSQSDGRRIHFRESSVNPSACVRVVFTGKHGHQSTHLWFPEDSLEDVSPPVQLQELLQASEKADTALQQKMAQLKSAQKAFAAQMQEWTS